MNQMNPGEAGSKIIKRAFSALRRLPLGKVVDESDLVARCADAYRPGRKTADVVDLVKREFKS